jgi:AAA15 family ATPase/GTPase
MLKQLRIQNFKGWKDTGHIRMSPITLFFGANSSGKSSIGQFLMMLKQTVESSDRKSVFYPGGKNSAVQLGSFQEMIFQHNIENKISFEYEWILPHKIEFKDTVLSSHHAQHHKLKESMKKITAKSKKSNKEERIKLAHNNLLRLF